MKFVKNKPKAKIWKSLLFFLSKNVNTRKLYVF